MVKIRGRITRDMSITFRPDFDVMPKLQKMKQIGDNLSSVVNKSLRKYFADMEDPKMKIIELCAERIRAAKYMTYITTRLKEIEDTYGISEEEAIETHEQALVRIQKEELLKIPEELVKTLEREHS